MAALMRMRWLNVDIAFEEIGENATTEQLIKHALQQNAGRE